MQLQYEKAQRLWEKGRISKEELDALRPEVALRLRSVTGSVTEEKSVVAEEAVMKVLKGKGVVEHKGAEPPRMAAVPQLSAEALEMVAGLRQAQAEIDKRKGELSNSLGDYPKNVPVPHITEQILALRDEWGVLSKQIKAIEMGSPPTGMPYHPSGGAVEPLSGVALHEAIVASLPEDKFELKNKERNLVALLSKDRGKLRAAKDPAKKHELTVKIQQAELVLAAMRERLRG